MPIICTCRPRGKWIHEGWVEWIHQVHLTELEGSMGQLSKNSERGSLWTKYPGLLFMLEGLLQYIYTEHSSSLIYCIA